MAETCGDLPDECWELVFSRLDHYQHLEPLSVVCKQFLWISSRLQFKLTVVNPTIPLLHKLFVRFQCLKEIDLSEFRGNLEDVLHQIARSSLQIECLNLANQKQFPVKGLKELGSKMKKLKILICSKCILCDSDLQVIATSLPSLEELDISRSGDDDDDDGGGDGDSMLDSNSIGEFTDSGSSFGSFVDEGIEIRKWSSLSGVVTDEGIEVLASKLVKLRKINLLGNSFITDRSLISLSSICVFLSEIKVNCCFITQNGIDFVIRNSANLVSVSVIGLDFTSPISSLPPYNTPNLFTSARALSDIGLWNVVVSDCFLLKIVEAGLPLKKLTLSYCKKFTIYGIRSILAACCQSLEYLCLRRVDFLTDQCMDDLSPFLQNLTSVDLDSCPSLTNSTFFNLTKTCPKLAEIRMVETSLGKAGFSDNLKKNLQIRSLRLDLNKILKDESLRKYGLVCPNLELLELNHCSKISEEGISKILKSCLKVRELSVIGCRGVSNLGMKADFSKLEVLRASRSGIDDCGLETIGKWCNCLLNLDLEGCLKVTNRGVKEVVGKCRRLRVINLRYCNNVSVEIVAWMVFASPSLRKIIPPGGFVLTKNQRMLFLRHGCLVCNG